MSDWDVVESKPIPVAKEQHEGGWEVADQRPIASESTVAAGPRLGVQEQPAPAAPLEMTSAGRFSPPGQRTPLDPGGMARRLGVTIPAHLSSTIAAGAQALKEQAIELIPMLPDDMKAELQEAATNLDVKVQEIAQQDMAAAERDLPPESAEYYLHKSLHTMAVMAPALAVSYGTRNPTVGASVFGTQAFADKYGDARARGRSPDQAMLDGAITALIEAGTERLPLGILTKEGGKAFARIWKGAAAEGIQEPVASALGMAYDAGILKQPEWFDEDGNFRTGEAVSQLIDAGIIGTIAGGGLAVTVSGPEAVQQKWAEYRARKDAAPIAKPEPKTQPQTAPAATPEQAWTPVETAPLGSTDDAGEVAATPADTEADSGVEYFDPRLKRQPFREQGQKLVDELQRGGGVAFMSEQDVKTKTLEEGGRVTGTEQGFRTPSVNPAWAQSIIEDEAVSVRQIKQAWKKAAAGEKLGVRQARIVSRILDELTNQRTDPANMDYVRQELERARALRAPQPLDDEQVDAFMARPLPPDAGQRFEETEYPIDMTGEGRTLFELMTEAGEVDEATTEALLERASIQGMSSPEIARGLLDIIERGNPDEESEESGLRAGPQDVSAEPGAGAQAETATAGDEAAPELELTTYDDPELQALNERVRTIEQEAQRDVSLETGDPSDLFSQAQNQQDLVQQARNAPKPAADESLAAMVEQAMPSPSIAQTGADRTAPLTPAEVERRIAEENNRRPKQMQTPFGQESYWRVSGFPGDQYGDADGGIVGVALGYESVGDNDYVRVLYPDGFERLHPPHNLFPATKEEFEEVGASMYAAAGEAAADDAAETAEPETLTLPVTRKGWKGLPLAEIELLPTDGGEWQYKASATWGDGGFGGPPNKARFASRDEALRAAIEDIRRHTLGEQRTKEMQRLDKWLADHETTLPAVKDETDRLFDAMQAGDFPLPLPNAAESGLDLPDDADGSRAYHADIIEQMAHNAAYGAIAMQIQTGRRKPRRKLTEQQIERLQAEDRRLTEEYQAMFSQYLDVFGEPAHDALELMVDRRKAALLEEWGAAEGTAKVVKELALNKSPKTDVDAIVAGLPKRVATDIRNDPAPLNPKVAEAVRALNAAGVRTTMSGDLYGDELVYIDVAAETLTRLDTSRLPDGWTQTHTYIPVTKRDVLGAKITEAEAQLASNYEKHEPKVRLARAGSAAVTATEADALAAAFSKTPERRRGKLREAVDALPVDEQATVIEQLRSDNERLHKLAFTDQLTGLPNRLAWIEETQEGTVFPGDPDLSPIQVRIDLDGFKWINDNMGHASGDEVLRAVGETLRERANYPFRIGGDEFFLSEVAREEAQQVVDDIRERLSNVTVTFEHPDGTTTEKVGIEFSAGIGATYEEAESALQREKASKPRRAAEPAGVRTIPAEGQPDQNRDAAAEESALTERPAPVEDWDQAKANAGRWWRDGGPEAREDMLRAGGWVTPKGNLTRQAASWKRKPWEEMSAAAKNIIARQFFIPPGKGAPAVDAAAQQADTGATTAQREAGNYQKGHVRLHGLDISIETPAGERRRPEWPPLAYPYGYIRRTEGADGEHVDVFLGPDAENPSLSVYVIDQLNADGSFDEHKVMLGFDSLDAAQDGYLENFDQRWVSRMGAVVEFPEIDLFRGWIERGNLTAPAEDQADEFEAEVQYSRAEDAAALRKRRFADDNLRWDLQPQVGQFMKASVGDRDVIGLSVGYNANGDYVLEFRDGTREAFSPHELFPATAEEYAAQIQETGNAPDSTPAQRRGRQRDAADQMGAGSVPAVAGRAQPAPGRNGNAARNERREPEGNFSLFDDPTPLERAARADELLAENGQPRPDPATADPDDDRRGADDSDAGTQPDDDGSRGAEELAGRVQVEVERRRAAQREAEGKPIRRLDRANIADTLPMLLSEQQDDVLKAERSFFEAQRDGMLFTNGTGTGKTYTGLGVAKRFYNEGKRNILILVPTDMKAKDWIEDGRDLLLPITQLASTQDAGAGVVITTYANFGANDAVLDRDWDAVIADESHYLSANQNGDETLALAKLRMITNHRRGIWEKARRLTPAYMAAHAELKALDARAKDLDVDTYSALRSAAVSKLVATQPAVDARRATLERAPRSKVVFLSATPFPYHFSLDYAEGYLFDYAPPGTQADGGGYNAGNARERWFMTNLGYRMRYNKLTQPDAEVNIDVMERQLNEWLKKEGALSGRTLKLDFDYSREFVEFEDGVGKQIDAAVQAIHNHKNKFDMIRAVLNDRWDYHERNKLLEAIKAKQYIPRIEQHLALGRKVVVFHSYKKDPPANPFRFDENAMPGNAIRGASGATHEMKAQWATEVRRFYTMFPDMRTLDLSGLATPIQKLTQAFGKRVVLINGDVPKGQRRENKAAFNRTGSGKDIIVVQRQAGREGISLHDVGGDAQRALIDLGLPVSPTDAIQTEGRTYRFGVQSDAVFEYAKLGLYFEDYAFATRISQRSRTAENLALGNLSRDLETAFKDGYINSTTAAPSLDQGKGGKEKDARMEAGQSAFEQAKTFYFANKKKTARDKASEGVDYFATPEPLGLKMVEWARIRPGDDVLEPSAGHGAIARFFPSGVKATMVEPSAHLLGRLRMYTTGKIVDEPFEKLHAVNKFDAIVMNPPFGTAGKTAMDHLEKAATKHLKPGGRIVALLPDGPSMQKRLDKFLESEAAADLYPVAKFLLPSVTFERAGTRVVAQVIVLEKQPDVQDAPHALGDRDLQDVERIGELFDRIENMELPERAVPTPPTARVLEAAGLKVVESTTNNGKRVWEVSGNTRQNAGLLKAQGGRWYGPKQVWSYYDGDPSKKIAEALQRSGDLIAEPGAPYGVVPTQIESAAFKKWFGDSKVVDENGEPLVVYHGTDAPEFTVFDTMDFPSWFAEDQQTASQYESKTGEGRPRVMSVYLAVQNPLVLPETFDMSEDVELPDFIEMVEQAGGPRLTAEQLAFSDESYAGLGFEFVNSPEFRATVEAAGFDGIRVMEQGEWTWGVFRPEQIKSAVGNRGTFDPNDASIIREDFDNYYGIPPRPVEVFPLEGEIRPVRGPRVELIQRDAFPAGLDVVNTAEDAAHVIAPVRRFAQENMIALVTDKDGKPLAIIRHTIGSVDSAGVFPVYLIGAIHQVPNAANVWFAHNHPSGNPSPSRADKDITRKLHALLEGSGVTPQGMLVAAPGGRFSFYHPAGVTATALDWEEVNATAAARTGVVPVLEREFRRLQPGEEQKSITSPDQMKDLARKVLDGQVADGGERNGILLFNAHHSPVGFLPMTVDDMRSLREPGKTRARLLEAASTTNASAFAGAVDQLAIDAMPNIARDLADFGGQAGLRYLDFVTGDGESAAQLGILEPSAEAAPFGALAIAEEGAGGGRKNLKPQLTQKVPLFNDGFDVPSDNAIDAIRQALQDKYIDLRRIQDAVQTTSGRTLEDAEDTYLQEELYHGAVETDINRSRETLTIEPMMQAVEAAGVTMQEADDYLYALHAKERNARIAEINPVFAEGGGSGMTDAEADEILARFADNPKIGKLAELRNRITAAHRKLLIESGLEREETVRAWDALYDHYVPLKKAPEGSRISALLSRGRGFEVAGRARRAFGRRSRAENIIANLIAQYETDVVRAHKAEVGRSFLRLVQRHPNAELWEVNRIEYAPVVNRETGLVEYKPNPRYKLKDNVLNVRVAGEDHHITLHGARGLRLAHALKNLGAADAGLLVSNMARVNRFLSLVNTGLNPEFVISNLFRDLQTAGINLAGTEADEAKLRIIGDVGKSWRGIRAALYEMDDADLSDSQRLWRDEFLEFEAVGGKTGWIDAHNDVDRLQAELLEQMADHKRGELHPKKLFNTVKGFVENENTAVENAIRLSAYVHAKQLGLSKQRAASLAKNLTVNFNRKGEYGFIANSLYLFYNASVQGSVRMLQALKHRKVRKIAAGITVFAAVLDILNRLLGGEDDDGISYYDKLQASSPYITERNIVIMIPGTEGNYIAIPAPWGYNVLHVGGQEIGAAASAALGLKHDFNAMDSALRFIDTAIGAFNPLGNSGSFSQFLSPTATDWLIQISENKDWLGRPLMPEPNPFDRSPPPNSERYWSSTSEVSKWIAAKLNRLTGGNEVRPGMVDISPAIIDHIASFWTGGAGRFVADTVDAPLKYVRGEEVELRDVVGVRKVLGGIEDRGTMNAYYENLEQIAYVEDELKLSREQKDPALRRAIRDRDDERNPYYRAREYAKFIEKQVRRRREQLDELDMKTGLTLGERRAKREELEAEMERFMKRLNKKIERYRAGQEGDDDE